MIFRIASTFAVLLFVAQPAFSQPSGPPQWPNPIGFSIGGIAHEAQPTPGGTYTPPVGPGPTLQGTVKLYDGNTHVFDAVFTAPSNTGAGGPSVGAITSPLGAVTSIVNVSFGQYQWPTYSFNVSGPPAGDSGLIPIGTQVTVTRLKHISYYATATGVVQTTISYYGQTFPVQVTLTGNGWFSTTQYDGEKPYDVSNYPGVI